MRKHTVHLLTGFGAYSSTCIPTKYHFCYDAGVITSLVSIEHLILLHADCFCVAGDCIALHVSYRLILKDAPIACRLFNEAIRLAQDMQMFGNVWAWIMSVATWLVPRM